METTLFADPAYPCDPIETIHASAERISQTLLRFRYVVIGGLSQLRIPEPAPPFRTARLWEATCFEAFLRAEGENGYLELNFSPSGQWAAYGFTHYREGMADVALTAAPEIEMSRSPDRIEVEVAVSPSLGAGPYSLNIAAILENLDGERSFWAARHPADGADFHHPSCFIHRLPPTGSA